VPGLAHQPARNATPRCHDEIRAVERLLDEVVIGRPDRINGAVELGGIGGAVREQVTTTRRLRPQPAGLKARV
jgi:hypothetical protein